MGKGERKETIKPLAVKDAISFPFLSFIPPLHMQYNDS